jgi:hypothetical protein
LRGGVEGTSSGCRVDDPLARRTTMSSTDLHDIPQRAQPRNPRLLHIADAAPGAALCGARVTRIASDGSDSRRCIVCLDLATGQRHHAR